MIDRSPLWVGGAGVALVAACCGIPLLAGVLGTVSVAALLLWGARILAPALGLAVGAAALVFYLRCHQVSASSASRDERTGTPARNPQ